MATDGPFVVGIAELLRAPGTRRHDQLRADLDDLGTSAATVPPGAEVVLDAELEVTGGDLVVEGTVAAPWEGRCRRCLEPVAGVVAPTVREVFERRPTEGETYPLAEDRADLEPLVRDAVLLALPLAPLCGPDCKGPDPERFPAEVEGEGEGGDGDGGEPPRDPRWAALDDLDLS